MLIIRSLLFNAAFYLNLVLWVFLLIPGFFMPRRVFMRLVRLWASSSLWLLRVLAGTKIEVRGREKIPPGGALVASKHQSTWETFALVTIFDDPTFILKRELMWIPFFGWYTWKAGCVRRATTRTSDTSACSPELRSSRAGPCRCTAACPTRLSSRSSAS